MNWQPIETAPKDGSYVLLGWVNNEYSRPSVGWWDNDRHAKKPRPYWSFERERLFGTRDARQNPPTHWIALPEPPK